MEETSARDTERRKVANLVRAVAAFVLVPTVTIGGVMLADPASRDEHWLHAGVFAVLSVASVVAMAFAPGIAARFVKDEGQGNP